TISIDGFDATYQALPASIRADVAATLAPIRSGARPLLLLLLFGFGSGPELRLLYQKSIARIFASRPELAGCSLAVKVPPAASGVEERIFIDWLKDNVPAQVFPVAHPLNLEFMLPQLTPDFTLAGLCGALPIIRRVTAGQPIALAELIEAWLEEHPADRTSVPQFLRRIQVW